MDSNKFPDLICTLASSVKHDLLSEIPGELSFFIAKRPPIEWILFGAESPAFRDVALVDLERKAELYCVLARKTHLRRESEENESETCGVARPRSARGWCWNKAWNTVHPVEKKAIKDLPCCRISPRCVSGTDSALAIGFFFHSPFRHIPRSSLFYSSPFPSRICHVRVRLSWDIWKLRRVIEIVFIV